MSTPAASVLGLLQSALQAHQAGRLAEAEAAYRAVLAMDGRQADALHLLGALELQKGNVEAAETLMRRALGEREDPYFLGNLGNLLKGAGRPDEAEVCYRRALDLKPDLVEAHNNLANLFKDANRMEEAEAAYRRAVELRPDYAEAWNNLGTLLKAEGRWRDAEPCYRRALELKPELVEAHNNLGNLLKDSWRPAEAESCYRRALALNPAAAEAHNNLGRLQKEAGNLAEAEASYRRALELKPAYHEAWNNLANLLKDSGRHEEAEAAYHRALALKSDFVDAHNNLGNLLKDTWRLAEAEAAYRRALELKPDFADARWNLSLLLLLLGRYDEAWPSYEARYDPKRIEVTTLPPRLPYPQWQGESLAGKSLVIWPEQGFGDYIHFIRYAPLLKAAGLARLTVLCAPALERLLATATNVDAVVADPAAVPPQDYWAFAMSMPSRFATTLDAVPAQLLYLHALPERSEGWRDRLSPQAGRTRTWAALLGTLPTRRPSSTSRTCSSAWTPPPPTSPRPRPNGPAPLLLPSATIFPPVTRLHGHGHDADPRCADG
ncbi:MAG TPA: tetratricopeptide repeat protein [Rhodocyclaceae bacterium]|nr:tetratricopeptide repeat protein [Rhodocyclaceae bacterium]